MIPYFVGWFVILVAFVITQTRFYNEHQKVRGWWRPSNTPWLVRTSHEMREMYRATWQPDEDEVVERRRRTYLRVLVAGLLYLTVGFAIAIWLLR